MKIESSAFLNGEMIPAEYTCDGEGINPELLISGVPESAKSLALIVDDPDAPMGNFNHWVAWNINPAVQKIEEDSLPKGAVSGINDNEEVGYIGPCPPGGIHRYYLKIYALDALLDLGPDARKKDLEEAMAEHILSEAELLGKYSRV